MRLSRAFSLVLDCEAGASSEVEGTAGLLSSLFLACAERESGVILRGLHASSCVRVRVFHTQIDARDARAAAAATAGKVANAERKGKVR